MPCCSCLNRENVLKEELMLTDIAGGTLYMPCSWCYDTCEHALLDKGSRLHRSTFECQGCLRRTLICKDCKVAMSRGQKQEGGLLLGANDKVCLVCKGVIPSWDLSKEEIRQRTVRVRWCPWCFEKCEQVLQSKSDNRSASRSVYCCSACGQTTLKCMKCKEHMTKGTVDLDDRLCLTCGPFSKKPSFWDMVNQSKHEVLQQYPDPEALTKRDADLSKVVGELQRDSEYREKASKAGMLRPFLLLASMHPKTRWDTACSLGFSVLEHECLGDAHAEAWLIINKPISGILARATGLGKTLKKQATGRLHWHEVLEAVGASVFKGDKAVKAAAKGASVEAPETIRSLEELFLVKVFPDDAISKFSSLDENDLHLLMQTDDAKKSQGNLRECGFTNEEAIACGVKLSMLDVADNILKNKRETGDMERQAKRNAHRKLFTVAIPVIVMSTGLAGFIAIPAAMLALNVGKIVLGSTPGRLLTIVTYILVHRMMLGLHGVNLDQYAKESPAASKAQPE